MLFADVIWPSLAAQGQLFLWTIVTGFLIELVVLRFAIPEIDGWTEALFTCTFMNFVSTVLGCILFPLVAMPSSLITDPGHSAAGLLLYGVTASLVSTVIECAVLRAFFGILGHRSYTWILAANAASIAVAGVPLLFIAHATV